MLVFFLTFAFLSVPSFNAKTINVDGDASDWAGVSQLFSDPVDMPGASWADIISCYVTDDSVYLYVRIDYVGGPEITWGPHLLYLDVDQNPATGQAYRGIGADYVVDFYTTPPALLELPGGGHVSDIIYAVNKASHFIESCISLADIGVEAGQKIDLILQADASSDYAPDEGHATYTTRVLKPLGGDVFQINKISILTPYLIIGIVILTTTTVLIKKRKH